MVKIERFKRGLLNSNRMIIHTSNEGTLSNETKEVNGLTLRNFGFGLEYKVVDGDSFLVSELRLCFKIK